MESPDEIKAHQRTKRGERGKRRVLGRWSHHMSFKMNSSRKVEMERPLGGFSRKDKGKSL
jgi:hypothetical protein